MGDVVVVGHGPSILSGLGKRIDEMTVVRVKQWPPPYYEPEHFGTRCDYLVVKIDDGRKDVKTWVWKDAEMVPGWKDYWLAHNPRNKSQKHSNGLAAVFLAMHHLKPERLYVIGFDRLLGNLYTWKWWDKRKDAWKSTATCHDWAAEQKALAGIGVPVIDLSKETHA